MFDVTAAEAATPELADERADSASKTSSSWTCTPISCATTPASEFRRDARRGRQGRLEQGTRGKEQTIDDLKFDNYFKEIFLDSDTKVALISTAPSDVPQDWFLTNEMMARRRDKVNKTVGRAPAASPTPSSRPGSPAGWRRSSRGIAELKPESIEGLHDRRQHPQGHQPLSLAHGRREGRLPGLREVPQGGHQERLRPQGPVPALARAAVPQPARLCRRERRGQGGEGLAAAQLHHLSLRLPHMSAAIPPGRWRSSSGPAASPGSATSPTSRENTA